MGTAVLVIDVQQGLCEGEGAPFDLDATLSRINDVVRHARAAGAPVVHVQHEASDGPLEHGSQGWRLADALEVEPGDLRVRKITPDAFLCTDLETVLRERAVTDLVVCGMHSEFCVDTTVRRALALGFPVVLVSDAHTSAGNAAVSAAQVIAHHNVTLANITSFGARVRTLTAADVRIASS